MTTTMTDLVNRFLTWPVPADVHPDGTPGQPGRTGTNLMTAQQAEAMLTHVLGDVLANKHGGLLSPKGGKHHKKRTHKAERQEAKKGEE